MKSSIFTIAALSIAMMSLIDMRPTQAQTTARQRFRVAVPSNISIVAPDEAVITHDETNSNQVFPAQRWSVVGNTMSGVSVSFSTPTPFIHVDNPSYKRDARLGLVISSSSGPGGWVVTQPFDMTDYASNDNSATVTARSNATGAASFGLSVTFVTGTYGSFPAGIYETTVVGTITAN
ncbi:hypothetical protein [Neorhodopirellula pilleata]|uniref:DUF4402 domain-containing protein n=1 Tax=Neorhodopirellula pilleata TaxID=2714738 RepID=A0A5C6ATA2_9BACT|nr:hypothetical protein [Neorhodopirellula pilleata]TWU03283.1 hypothetical protein Pla100_02010 [Neorhodopirellula pilleata]